MPVLLGSVTPRGVALRGGVVSTGQQPPVPSVIRHEQDLVASIDRQLAVKVLCGGSHSLGPVTQGA